jgi:hypothetical protein
MMQEDEQDDLEHGTQTPWLNTAVHVADISTYTLPAIILAANGILVLG